MYLYQTLLILIIGFNLSKGSAVNPKVMAVVIGNEPTVKAEYIQIMEDLTTIEGASTKVTVEYRCTEDRLIGVEVVADVNFEASHKIFQKVWRCHKSDQFSGMKFKKVKLKLPPEVAYNYNAFNKHVIKTSRSKVRVWMLENEWWPSCYRNSDCYTRSSVKVSYNVKITPPFSRPFYKPHKQCKSWSWNIIADASSADIPKCPYEEEVIEVIKYPLVLGGDSYGVYRQFKPYNNPDLEKERQDQVEKPMFTICVWLYILEYCRGPPRPGLLCSIMHRFTWDGEFRTIMMLLTPEGRVHIQIHDIAGHHKAGLSYFNVPKHQWTRVVLQFQLQTWKLFINYGENFRETLETEYRHSGDPTFYDDTKDLFTFGGSEYMPSFKGYIGQATIYRNKIIDPEKIPMPSKFHPMFELQLAHREKKCSKYLDWVMDRVNIHKTICETRKRKRTCRHPFVEIIQSATDHEKAVSILPTCKPKRKKINRSRRQVDIIVKKMVWGGRAVDFKEIADLLYENATTELETGLEKIQVVFPVLKQAACYGNMDAMYMISTILNNGIYIKADEIQSQAYLMLAALDNHRLAAMSLGHKHKYGIDGVTKDREQSYRYFKFVADTTNADKERHKDTDFLTVVGGVYTCANPYNIRIRCLPKEGDNNIYYYNNIGDDDIQDNSLQHFQKYSSKYSLPWSLSLQNNSPVFTESIRLTDEAAIHEQTDEDGDIFHWLTLQAKQGVLSAQTRIGRALFWGQQGLKRNLASAVEYFKMSAETGDAQSQYDYGIVLIRGQGIKKDVEAGLNELQKAAKQENPAAINAIGWHAMNFERDMVKAAEHYERSYRLGNPDAAYNLGILYLYGTYPDKEKNADLALDYFIYAATRGQIDAGVAVAFQTIKGTNRQRRDVNTAVEWARFIAEKNPSIGHVLRKALQAYRKGKRDISLFYYTLAADAGLEVGSFNSAWLCEENKEGVTSFIEKECVWSRYNMSVQREPQFVDPYALLKMGDFYWYGCGGSRDTQRAALYYAEAAKKNDPQALFNLGFMIEEGAFVSAELLGTLDVPYSIILNNITLLDHLYSRCKDSTKSEAYMPCSLALWRIQALAFWLKYQTVIKVTSFTGITAMTALSVYMFVRTHIRRHNENADSI